MIVAGHDDQDELTLENGDPTYEEYRIGIHVGRSVGSSVGVPSADQIVNPVVGTPGCPLHASTRGYEPKGCDSLNVYEKSREPHFTSQLFSNDNKPAFE